MVVITTSYLYEIGKATALKLLMQGKIVQLLGITDINMHDVASEATSCISAVTVQRVIETCQSCNISLVCKNGKGNKYTAPQLKSLPLML